MSLDQENYNQIPDDNNNAQLSGKDLDINMIISEAIERVIAKQPVLWINAVKEIRDRSGMSLKASNDAVQNYRTNILHENLQISRRKANIAISIMLLYIIAAIYTAATRNTMIFFIISLAYILYSALFAYYNFRHK
jgi:hypothetical protein